MDYTFLVKFPDSEIADANELADDLERDLCDEVPDADFTRRRSDPLSQDFGATLLIVLGAPGVVALAKGVQAWMAKRNDVSAEITIEAPDGGKRSIKIQGRLSRRELQVLTELGRDKD